MKLNELALNSIQPYLTVREHELLKKAEHIHEDPTIHTKPDQMRLIARLMKMGLLRMLHDPEIHYELTEKGKQVMLK